MREQTRSHLQPCFVVSGPMAAWPAVVERVDVGVQQDEEAAIRQTRGQGYMRNAKRVGRINLSTRKKIEENVKVTIYNDTPGDRNDLSALRLCSLCILRLVSPLLRRPRQQVMFHYFL